MYRLASALLGLAALGIAVLAPTPAAAVEIESKAQKITLTGRVHTQWNYTSVKREVSNEFLMRRVRTALKMQINDWVEGTAEVDFGEGKTAVKDAYLKLQPRESLALILGQTKRRFDLFELVSSTQILVIERDGRIRGVKELPSLSFCTESLQYSDRDIGAFLLLHSRDRRLGLEAAVTNGSGANAVPALGEKAFQGRVTVLPLAQRPLALAAAVSAHPFAAVTATDSTKVDYASAFELSAEWGDFDAGLHLQAGFVAGDNWKRFDKRADATPRFWAVQSIFTHKHKLAPNRWLEAVEPLVRLGFADPDTDTPDDGGTLVTPGINFYLAHRNRVAINADIFVPQKSGVATPTTTRTDTEVGLKVQSFLYW